MAKRKSKAARSPRDRLDNGLVLDGNGRARLRKPGPQAWTKQKEKNFLSVLSDTCNVKLAAQEDGVSPQHAYARRKSHAAFRPDPFGAANRRPCDVAGRNLASHLILGENP